MQKPAASQSGQKGTSVFGIIDLPVFCTREVPKCIEIILGTSLLHATFNSLKSSPHSLFSITKRPVPTSAKRRTNDNESLETREAFKSTEGFKYLFPRLSCSQNEGRRLPFHTGDPFLR